MKFLILLKIIAFIVLTVSITTRKVKKHKKRLDFGSTLSGLGNGISNAIKDTTKTALNSIGNSLSSIGSSTTAPVNDANNAAANGQTQVPNNNGQTQVPNTNGQAQVPNTNDQTQVPNNNGQTQVPNTNGQTQVPNTNGQTQVPNTNGQTQVPNTNGQTQVPNTNSANAVAGASGVVQAGTDANGSKLYCFEQNSPFLAKLQIRATAGKFFVCVDENDALAIIKGDPNVANKLNTQNANAGANSANATQSGVAGTPANNAAGATGLSNNTANGTAVNPAQAGVNGNSVNTNDAVPNNNQSSDPKKVAGEVLKILAQKIKEDPQLNQYLNDPKTKDVIKKVLKLVYSTSKQVADSNLDIARGPERDAALDAILADPSKADQFTNKLRNNRKSKSRKNNSGKKANKASKRNSKKP